MNRATKILMKASLGTATDKVKTSVNMQLMSEVSTTRQVTKKKTMMKRGCKWLMEIPTLSTRTATRKLRIVKRPSNLVLLISKQIVKNNLAEKKEAVVTAVEILLKEKQGRKETII